MFSVTVVTGTRAEYGLLRPVLRKLAESQSIEPHLLVTGAHLAPEYGNTASEIEGDGFAVAAKIDILSHPVPGGRLGTAKRMAYALEQFIVFFSEEDSRPDAVLLLGDRYEILAAGQAAALLDIPLVHISGGDVTVGADDDWFRHCLTKMAKLHFPSCEEYRQRIIRMGEEPGRVFNVGGLGDENIRSMQLLSLRTLTAGLGLELPEKYALVTMHPETATRLSPEEQAHLFLAALDEHPELFYLFTAANADAGGDVLNSLFSAWCNTRKNAAMVASLGVLRYLSAMKQAAVVIGNSSSGVVETPSMGVPAIDIGRRQQGRVTAENVLHCGMEKAAISAAIEEALQPDFCAMARRVKSPYNGGDTSGSIVRILEEFLQSGALRGPKVFYDGKEQP